MSMPSLTINKFTLLSASGRPSLSPVIGLGIIKLRSSTSHEDALSALDAL